MVQDGASWPASGTVEERGEQIVRHLEALIPLAEGAPEIEAAEGRLKALAGEPRGREILARIVDRLRVRAAFELEPIPIQEILQPDPIHQVDHTSGGLIRTISAVRIRADPQAVAKAIYDRQWDWWHHGRVLDWRRDATVRFVLKPLSTRSFRYVSLPASLGIELSAAEGTEESTNDGHYARPKTVYRTRFSGDFDGPGRYEIVGVAGGSLLRSIWDGVNRRALRVKLLPMSAFLRVHLGGEKGNLSWPLPPGSGFPGLIELLQA